MYKFEVYKDRKGEWRWRFKASNGDILADSGQGYKRKGDCEASVNSVRALQSDPRLVVEEERLQQLLKSGELTRIGLLVNRIEDPDVRIYLSEASKNLQVNAYASTVLSIWKAGIRQIQLEMLATGSAQVHSKLLKYEKIRKRIETVDDLESVKESSLLLAAQDLGIFDKAQKQVLEECLNLRNRCGHPNKYRPGLRKLCAFLEDMESIVFPPEG